MDQMPNMTKEQQQQWCSTRRTRVWSGHKVRLLLNMTLEYKGKKMQSDDSHPPETHVRSPARKVKTSTNFVLSVIYLLLRSEKSRANQR